jgi:hypothetical protein
VTANKYLVANASNGCQRLAKRVINYTKLKYEE